MRFSVLVPVYNAGRYLEACVQSVLRQTERDYELVLVDDGSTDGSGEACDRFAALDPGRIRVLHQPNRGLIRTRRTGISLARGEYCVFLDADDYLADETLAVIRETIERTNADVVLYDNFNYYDEEGTTERNPAVFADYTAFAGEQKRKIYELMIASWRINNIWMKAIRTPLLQADDTPYEKFADNPHGEDLLQTLYPVTHAEKVVYRALPLYYYRRRRGSICTKIDLDGLSRQLEDLATEQLERYMAIWGMDTPEYQAILAARRLRVMLTLFWQYYRCARGAHQKRAVLDDAWPAYARRCLDKGGAGTLGWLKRVQLNAVLHKNTALLDILSFLGRLQRKVKYGA